MSSENLSLSLNRIKLIYQFWMYETDKTTLWQNELQDQTLVIISFITRNIQSSSLSSKTSSLSSLRHRRASFLILNSSLSTEYLFLQDWIIHWVSLNHAVIDLHWLLLLTLLNNLNFLIFQTWFLEKLLIQIIKKSLKSIESKSRMKLQHNFNSSLFQLKSESL